MASNRGREAMMDKLASFRIRVMFVSGSRNLKGDLQKSVSRYRAENVALGAETGTPRPWSTAFINAASENVEVDFRLLELRRIWLKADERYRRSVTRLENVRQNGPKEDHLDLYARERHEQSLETHAKLENWLTQSESNVCAG